MVQNKILISIIALLAIAPIKALSSLPDFDSIEGMIGSVGNLFLQGTDGESIPVEETKNNDVSSENAKKKPTQKPHWGLEDEWTYSVQTDSDLSSLWDCMDYNLVGVCISVRMTWLGPKFTVGLGIEHYVRDVHVEVIPQLPTEDFDEYDPDSALPSSTGAFSDLVMMYPLWWKMSKATGNFALTDEVPGPLKDLGGQTTRSDTSRFLYSDVQVSGNTEKAIFDVIAGNTIGTFGYCDAPTTPGVAYYNSALDQFSWRWLATSEMVLTALWQVKYLNWSDIGRSYGSTFPRSGYIVHNNRFKTSVVSAIRATNISAENRPMYSGLAGLHAYIPLPQYASGSFTGSKYQTPQDAKSFKLHMIYPYVSEDKCTNYGANESWTLTKSTSKQREDEKLTKAFMEDNGHNSAAFKLYRPFRCCKKRGSSVLEAIDAGPIGKPK